MIKLKKKSITPKDSKEKISIKRTRIKFAKNKNK